MTQKARSNRCPKCGRQRLGEMEYSEELRTMIFACDVTSYTPVIRWGKTREESPTIYIDPVEPELPIKQPN